MTRMPAPKTQDHGQPTGDRGHGKNRIAFEVTALGHGVMPLDQHTSPFHRLAVLIDRVAVHTQSCRYRGFGQIADAFDFVQRSGYLTQYPA